MQSFERYIQHLLEELRSLLSIESIAAVDDSLIAKKLNKCDWVYK